MNYRNSEEARANRLASMTPTTAAVSPSAPAGPDKFQGRRQLREAAQIRVDRIVPDLDQPRKEFDADSLARLAESLKTRGQLQPIRVRWDEDRGVYVIVLGERRWRAAQIAGLETVTVIVVDGSPLPEELLEDQLVENALREDLKPVEQARAYQSLIARLGLSQRQLADRLQISQGAIAQALALLDLPVSVQVKVEGGELAPTVAYEVAKLATPEIQAELADRILAEGLTRAAVAEEVRAAKAMEKGRASKVTTRGKARRITKRVVRLPTGTVTVELRRGKGEGLGALIELLAEAKSRLETEQSGTHQGAAA
jgi:ParB family transcriptional regulator, chromosome partitioning protein